MQAEIDHSLSDKEQEVPVSSSQLPVATDMKTQKEATSNTAASLPYDSDGIIGHLVRFSNFWSNERKATIKEVPAEVLKYSSNIFGAAHVITEMAMFKASNKNGTLIQDPSKPLNWITQPVRTIFEDAFKRSRSELPVKELLFTKNPIKNIYQRIVDTDGATRRAREKEPNTPHHKIALSNPWQTRSTLAGLIVWGLSTFIPDRREDEAEIERMTIKQQVNPIGYVAERLKQAVWIPEWPEHKRQMVGLGIMASGVCSTINAWRGRGKDKHGVPIYTFNKGYLGTSLFTLASSFPLLFATDDRRGYGGFGALMMGRLLYLPSSIKKKFADKDSGRYWYTGATVSFQAENLAQNLIGGAEKLPDGTIVDHDEIRKHAKEKAKELSAERKKHHIGAEEVPKTVIHSTAVLEKAMPQQVEQHEQLQAVAG